jgi:hypothetical protein
MAAAAAVPVAILKKQFFLFRASIRLLLALVGQLTLAN